MGRYGGRFECGEPGCREIAHYEFRTRKEQSETYARYYKTPWKCVRHSQPNEVLSLSNRKVTVEIVSRRSFTDSGTDIGVYWSGGSGLLFGHGFKAFSKDFPEGTKLVVTAEIVLPEPVKQV